MILIMKSFSIDSECSLFGSFEILFEGCHCSLVNSSTHALSISPFLDCVLVHYEPENKDCKYSSTIFKHHARLIQQVDIK